MPTKIIIGYNYNLVDNLNLRMNMRNPLAVVIMAAGMGKRMTHWDGPKALLPLSGRPMLSHVLATARSLAPARIVIVAGHQRNLIMNTYVAPDVTFAIQEPQMGTAHAVSCAIDVISAFCGEIAVLSADVPLIRTTTLQEMLRKMRETGSAITVLTVLVDQPGSYGRIIRDGDKIVATVEARDATPEQLRIKEINSGVYVFDSEFLHRALPKIRNNNAQGEYYLTDLIAIAAKEGDVVTSITTTDEVEALGVNTLDDLERIHFAANTYTG